MTAKLERTPRTTKQNKDIARTHQTQWKQQHTINNQQHNHRLIMDGSLGNRVGVCHLDVFYWPNLLKILLLLKHKKSARMEVPKLMQRTITEKQSTYFGETKKGLVFDSQIVSAKKH